MREKTTYSPGLILSGQLLVCSSVSTVLVRLTEPTGNGGTIYPWLKMGEEMKGFKGRKEIGALIRH